MLDSSHGSACAVSETDSARKQCANRDKYLSRIGAGRVVDAVTPATVRSRADPVDKAVLWRGWIERAGAVSARLPVWSSRDTWLGGLRSWATSHALTSLCAAERVSITAATLLAIAAVMADYADHGTGRHVAVTRATIAERVGCSDRTVTAAWRVLRAAGWAVEAQRGHGSPATPSVGRRPSVYHLISHRRSQPVAATPEPVELRGIEPLTSLPAARVATTCTAVNNSTDFHLPPLGGVCSLTPVGNYSPSAHPREEKFSKPSKSRRWRAEPRPLALQRLADELVGNDYDRKPLCNGLHRAHIGAICDALVSAGIDPDVWTGPAIKNALDADMRRRGWSWPNRIEKPGAFLASRLRKLGSFASQPPSSAPSPPRTTTIAATDAAAAASPVHVDNRGSTAHQAGADIQRILDAAKRRRAAVVVP